MAGAVESGNRLRPLGVGELLDAAIKVCTAHAGVLLKAVLVVIVPVQIVSAIILASTVTDSDYLNITTSDVGTGDTAAFWAGQLVVVLLSWVSYLLATGACFHAIADGWLGRQPSWRDSLRFATRRAHSLLWISLLYGLGFVVGLVLCIAPGVWLAVAWSVAFPVLFVEDLRGSKALGRSFELVKDRWWPTCGVIAIGFVLAMIVSSIFTYGLGALALVNDSLGFLILLTTLGGLLSSLLTTPFQAAIISVVYFDLRVRKEGFDLELLAARLAGGDPLPRQQGGTPFAAPAGQAEWGAPHPAAPYWPPPPGWTPPEGDPRPASGGWQPPSEPAPTASTPTGGWAPPGAAAPTEATASGNWQLPAETTPSGRTTQPEAAPREDASAGATASGGWQLPAEAPASGDAPPAEPAPELAGPPAEPAPDESPTGLTTGDPLGGDGDGQTDAFGRRPDEDDAAAERAFGDGGGGDKPSGGSRWLPPRSDDG